MTIAEGNINFTKVPRNAAIFVGSDVTLRCAVKDSKRQRWMLDEKVVFSGYEVASGLQSRFDVPVVQGQRGQHDLQIRNVLSSDAGQYECGRTNVVSAQLVIIGELSLYLSIICTRCIGKE